MMDMDLEAATTAACGLSSCSSSAVDAETAEDPFPMLLVTTAVCGSSCYSSSAAADVDVTVVTN